MNHAAGPPPVASAQTATLDTTPPPPRRSLTAELAIIVPTFNESGNVARLVERLGTALRGICWEAVFVDDDSPDGTANVISEIGRARSNVRCITRTGRRGLASACIEGALATAAPYIAVIDADLQHDEALLPQMLAALRPGGLDLVVASRYMSRGGVGDWQCWRVLVSKVAGHLARWVVGLRLSDPMSGFFMIKRGAFAAALPHLSGRGFKILLDIMASSPRPLKVAELPYRFRRRDWGSSKLDCRVAREYLVLLLGKLLARMVSTRFLVFTAIGALGALVQLTVLRLALGAFAMAFPAAQAVATIAAMTGNFFLNNFVTYRDRRLGGAPLLRGLLGFYALCGAGAALNIAGATHLFAAGCSWWFAGLGGAVLGAGWNYTVSAAFVWRGNEAARFATRQAPVPAPVGTTRPNPSSMRFAAD